MSDTKSRQGSGRPRKFDPELGVEKAMRLFWEKGYDNVGIAELASEIGINPPSLYAAYGNKIGLYRCAIDRYGATHGAFLGKLADESRPLLEVLHEVLRDAIYVYSNDPDCKGCLVMSGLAQTDDKKACAIAKDRQEYVRIQIRELLTDRGPEIQDSVAEYFLFVLAGLSARARGCASQDALSSTLDHAFLGLAEMIDASAS